MSSKLDTRKGHIIRGKSAPALFLFSQTEKLKKLQFFPSLAFLWGEVKNVLLKGLFPSISMGKDENVLLKGPFWAN